jgi:hypothetical protein
MSPKPKQKEFPKAINEGTYTFSFESIHFSRAAAKYAFQGLVKYKFPHDSKHRVIRIGDSYGLYIW